MNPIVVTESIKTLLSQIKLKTKNVCTSISGSSVIIKRMSLEVKNLKEMRDQVFWEAEQYLPFDVSEVVMDFQLISRSSDGKADIILVAVKKSILENYFNCIKESGLKPAIVDVDFFALQNLFEENYPQNSGEAVAIVDLGASSIKITVAFEGIPVFTKDCAIGGNNLTAEIQKNLGLSFIDAETLKVSGAEGGNTPQEVNDLMNMMAENFATEIKRALDFYNASSTGAPVSYILLSGGSAKLPNLSKTVEDVVGLPTQLINPFNSISYDSQIFNQDYVQNIAPIASIAIGLALRAGAK